MTATVPTSVNTAQLVITGLFSVCSQLEQLPFYFNKLGKTNVHTRTKIKTINRAHKERNSLHT